jgi:hypothetical protein
MENALVRYYKTKMNPKKQKVIAVVDHVQQHKEKNISPLDYPMMNAITGRKLRKTFSHYYNSWIEYVNKRKKDGLDLKIPKK